MFEFLCLHNYIIVVLLSAHMAQLSEHWTSDQNVVGYNPGLCAWPIKCMCVWVGGGGCSTPGYETQDHGYDNWLKLLYLKILLKWC